MRRIKQLIFIVATIAIASACVKEPKPTTNQIEQRSLREWIKKYHPELEKNYQEDGGYYVEILDAGHPDSLAVTGKDVWIWYDFTGRDLSGNVCESRLWDIAYQQGTYTQYTHYIPMFRFSGSQGHTMLEGTYKAIANTLTIDGEPFEARYGTKMRLYLPSSIVKSNEGYGGDGGYEGQYSLDGNVPMIVDITLYGHIANPVAYEGNHIDSFANINGGLCTEHRAKNEATESNRRRYITRNEEDTETEVDTRPLEFFDGRWHQPQDTLAHLYMNYAYSPARQSLNFDAIGADTMMYPNQTNYNAGTIYGAQSLTALNQRIDQILVERFGEGITYDQVLETDSVNTKSSINVWYITRMLDGYIIDTNIKEVRDIVFGPGEYEEQALAFNTSKIEENNLVAAWKYAIPTLRLGQWAALVTVSNYAYGIAGKVGTHDTQTSTTTNYDYLNYYNYMNYMNSYYGYGYNGMYNNGYYGYNPYYYGINPIIPDDSTTTTTTTTITEIPSYTPLLFQLYIEP